MQGIQSPGRTPFSEITLEMEADKETEIWYAMRATYRREPDAMRLLEKEKLSCFVPMQYKISIKKGKKVRVLVPVIHNLLFVHACPSEVKRIKSQVTYLQYITDTRSGQKIIISDSEMQRFIAVAGTVTGRFSKERITFREQVESTLRHVYFKSRNFFCQLHN